MINQESLNAIDAARFTPQFMRPLYDRHSFAQIPQTIRYCLADSEQKGVSFGPRDDLYQQYDTVLLFFIDAFGWRFFERYLDSSPFLRRAIDEGVVTKLSSQFPSTTAAHVTTIHTGLPVGQSGVYEWFYYEPLLDAMIAPLLFSFAGDEHRNTLGRTKIAPTALYPTSTLYQELREHDVDSFVIQHQAYAISPYSQVVTNGARIVPYRTFPEALATLGELLDRQRHKAYYFLYMDTIDAICHHYGPDSPQVAAEIEAFLAIMEVAYDKTLAHSKGRTLFLLTADHGQTAIDPATTFYLDEQLPEIRAYLKTNQAGRLLVPAGSSRDMFLHVQDEHVDAAQALLRRALDGRAEVYRVGELIEQHFFGAEPLSAAFLRRVGDLVILPYKHESVWWYEKGKFTKRFHGSHGGLTRDEMETLLLVYPYT